MEHCLITGATGLIGSHLTRLLTSQFHLHLATRDADKVQNIGANKDSSVSVIPTDLTHPSFTERLAPRMDYLIHLAQSEHYRRFPEGAHDVFDVNIKSCFQLLEYARTAGVKTCVLASSGIVYNSEMGYCSEEDPILLKKDALGFYYTSKLCAEALAENYTSYMNIITLRFFYVYGPGQKNNMLVPRLVDNVLNERPLLLHGDEGMNINPIYVEEAAKAVAKALHLQKSQKINIAGPEVISLKKMGESIGECLGKKVFFDVQSTPPPHTVADIRKMSSLLGAPQVKFQEGIKRYLTAVGISSH